MEHFQLQVSQNIPSEALQGMISQCVALEKGPGWRWSACTIYLHRISCTTDRKQWLPASPCRGREGAGPAIWKSIIPGLMPASFTSADLVSASSVRSELGGPYSGSIMQFHLTKQLCLETSVYQKPAWAERPAWGLSAFFSDCFPGSTSHPNPGQKSWSGQLIQAAHYSRV